MGEITTNINDWTFTNFDKVVPNIDIFFTNKDEVEQHEHDHGGGGDDDDDDDDTKKKRGDGGGGGVGLHQQHLLLLRRKLNNPIDDTTKTRRRTATTTTTNSTTSYSISGQHQHRPEVAPALAAGVFSTTTYLLFNTLKGELQQVS